MMVIVLDARARVATNSDKAALLAEEQGNKGQGAPSHVGQKHLLRAPTSWDSGEDDSRGGSAWHKSALEM